MKTTNNTNPLLTTLAMSIVSAYGGEGMGDSCLMQACKAGLHYEDVKAKAFEIAALQAAMNDQGDQGYILTKKGTLDQNKFAGKTLANKFAMAKSAWGVTPHEKEKLSAWHARATGMGTALTKAKKATAKVEAATPAKVEAATPAKVEAATPATTTSHGKLVSAGTAKKMTAVLESLESKYSQAELDCLYSLMANSCEQVAIAA